MISTHVRRKNSIALLISRGFSESAVVHCLIKIRAAGLPISLVGTSGNLIHGQHGLVVRPDYPLNQLASDNLRFLIIPGTYECVTNLLISPDFHHQIKAVCPEERTIAIFNEAKIALEQAGILASLSDNVLHQGAQSQEAFCQQLITLASTSK